MMKTNEHIRIVGSKVILIPYEAKHVLKYHKWMESDELRTLTASEPLTLEQEYEMQLTWRESEDKCCFLILCKKKYCDSNDEIASLVGDTNLFLTCDQDGDCDKKSAEIEIMIAEPEARGKGYGHEATLLMLSYGLNYLNVNLFFAKIGISNYKSLKMFEKLHFKEQERSMVFHEITMSRNVNPEWRQWLEDQCGVLKLEHYHS